MAAARSPQISQFYGMQYFLFLLIFLGLPACTSEPASTWTDEQYAKVIADMQVAEAAMIGLSGERRDSVAEVYYKEIYQLHQTTKEEAVQALDELHARPERLEAVYELVMRELERQGAPKGDPVD